MDGDWDEIMKELQERVKAVEDLQRRIKSERAAGTSQYGDPNESVEDPLPVKSPHVEGPSSPFSDPDPSYLLEDDHNKGSGNDFAGVLSIDKAPDASGIDESPSESITKKRKSLNTPEARETHRDSLGPMTILENAVKKECGS